MATNIYGDALARKIKADLESTTAGVGASLIGIADAAGYTDAATVEAALTDLYLRKRIHHVRGVVTANIADLTAFTVASNDGLTYAAGERVLLVGQTTAAQCGIYVVGTVAVGVAPLTRAADFAAALPIVNGEIVEASEGTIWAGSEWKAMCTGAKVVATDDPLFYPRVCKAVVTLVAGTKTLNDTQGIALFSTTKSNVQVTCNTPDTVTLSIGYYAPVASRTAGKVGTGAVIVNALKADATTNTADGSSVDVLVTNW